VAGVSDPLLQTEGLRKSFGPTTVFSNVSFTVARGEIVAVLGESGVGKSTLLNGLAGLEPLDAGQIALLGQALPASEQALALWRRKHLGFVFQAFHVLPHLSVAQNVALPLMLLGADPSTRSARVQEMLAAVELHDLGERLPRTLSGGQLQRVAIARALVHRPPLVLADEPTGNLDAGTADRVLEVLAAQVRAQGAACVLVTHSMAAAARADRVLRLTAQGMVAA
jgi:putative ABC transport system ATP-binding protein